MGYPNTSKKIGKFSTRGGPKNFENFSHFFNLFLNMVWIIQKWKEFFLDGGPQY